MAGMIGTKMLESNRATRCAGFSFCAAALAASPFDASLTPAC